MWVLKLTDTTTPGKFHEAKSVDQTLSESLNAIESFDVNQDGQLSREEFALLITTFAKTANVSPHELIDFMVVTSGTSRECTPITFDATIVEVFLTGRHAAVKDNSEMEKAYIKSVKQRTSDETINANLEKQGSENSLGGLWKQIRGQKGQE